MFATFIFTLSVMIFITVNAVRTIIDEWQHYYYRSWGIIIFTSLSTIILWVFYLYGIIERLS